ncbi:MAG TPA: DUF3806 domain-containing protein [Chthoniobacteraceae bacterium]|nr:DUF3806 domain-containing protein [Chthoniobacteraceae bacterium]
MGDDQKITLLAPDDESRLAQQRAVVEQYLGDEQSRANYQKAAGKLGLLRALIEQRIFRPDQAYELQCMGIILGDAFVREMGMEWIMVEDAHGRDPAVRMPATSIIIFPLTMISKRIGKGEQVDVFHMFNSLADQIDQLKAQGRQS